MVNPILTYKVDKIAKTTSYSIERKSYGITRCVLEMNENQALAWRRQTLVMNSLTYRCNLG